MCNMVTWVVLYIVPYIRPGFCLENAQVSLYFWMPGSNSETWGGSVTIWVAISWYSSGPIFTVNGRNIAGDYVDILDNEVHCIVQMLFPNNDAVFQDDSSPIHTARSVQSWFEEHKDALQHLPQPAQSPNLYIIKQLVISRE